MLLLSLEWIELYNRSLNERQSTERAQSDNHCPTRRDPGEREKEGRDWLSGVSIKGRKKNYLWVWGEEKEKWGMMTLIAFTFIFQREV